MLKFVVRYAFHEKTFINSFLQSANKASFQQELLQNIDSIQNLNTIVAFIDQSYKINQLLPPELLTAVLRRATNIIDKDENLEFIKAMLLTLTLNRIENRALIDTIVQNVLRNLEKFQDDHLITIAESIIYNKVHVKLKIPPQKLINLFEQLSVNLAKQQVQLFNNQQMTNLQKLINLSGQYRFNKLIHEMLATLYGLLYQLKHINPEMTSEYLNYNLQLCIILDGFELLFTNVEIISDQKKQYQKLKTQFNDIIICSFNETALLNNSFSSKHIQVIQNYVKKYPKSPPVYLPKQIQNLIGNIYTSLVHDYNSISKKEKIIKNLSDLNNFAYFLTKTLKSFSLTDEDYKAIKLLVKNENNLYALAKTLETISTNVSNHNDLFHNHNAQGKHQHHHEHPKLRDSVLQAIENKINILMKGHLNPSDSLVIAFQSLVRIEDYEPQVAEMLEYFSYGQVLYKLKWSDFIIKLIPSLGIFSKRLTKSFYLEVQQNSGQFKLLTDLWDKIIQLLIRKFDQIDQDKLPKILFYMSQANKLDIRSSLNLINICRNKIDFKLFSVQQNAEIYYAFSRLNYQDNELYNMILENFVDKKLNMEQITLILAGLPINKQVLPKLIDQIQNQMDQRQFNQKVMLTYLQTLLTIQFTPKQELIDLIKKEFFKTKDTEFIIGCASSLLQYSLDQDILNCYLDFCIVHQKDFIKSPFYAHELHLLYQKLTLQDKFPKQQLQPIYQILTESKISLAKYHLSLKKITVSKLEEDVITNLKKLEWPQETINYYFIDDIIADPSVLKSIDQVIPYQIDFRVGKYCFEINGPKHYINEQPGKRRLDGQTQRKRDLLESIGMKYCEIDHKKYEKEGIEFLKTFQ